MDIQDVSLFVFILAGTLSSIGMMHWLRSTPAWLRVLAILVAIFIVSSVDEHLSRLIFNSARGTVFSRDFLITLGALLVYILVTLLQSRESARTAKKEEV